MSMPSLAELVANSETAAPSFFTKDSKIGDTITGAVVGVQTRQARDIQTRQPRVWENGDPVLQVVVSIQTDEKTDENDDGVRAVFIKFWGAQRQALLDALKDANLSDVPLGSTFTASFVGTEKSNNRAFSDTKLFEYSIKK